uniref:50S ribosomal protein L35 n=1 Tax=Theileria annulata TaxID=5874 RepID=A0A3B0MXM2_THEAN
MFLACTIFNFLVSAILFVKLLFLSGAGCICVISLPRGSSDFGAFRTSLNFISQINFSTLPSAKTDTRLFERRKYRLKIRAGGQFRIKPKTNHSVAKRFKVTATGKLMYRRATTQHKQRHKRRGAKCRLHRNGIITSLRMIRKIKSVLHNR